MDGELLALLILTVFCSSVVFGLTYETGDDVYHNFSTTYNSKGVFVDASSVVVGNINGSVDEVLIFSRTISFEEILGLYNASKTYYNFTDLDAGNYSFRAYAVDAEGALNFTEERSVEILEVNEAPDIEFVSPTPDDLSNQSKFSIYVNYTVNDSNGDDVYSFVDFDSSLVGWWRMDNNASVGENATHVYDWSGNGNNVSGANVTFSDGGRFGGGAEFDGGKGYFDVGRVTQIENLSEFAFSLWVKPNNISEYKYFLYKQGGGNDWGFARLEDGGDFYFKLDDEAGVLHSTTCVGAFQSDVWSHVVGMLNGTHVVTFIKGVECSSTVWPVGNRTYSGHDMHLFSDDGSGLFNGTADELIFFNRSLSAEEVLGLYNASKSYYNFTDLEVGNHSFQAFAVDVEGEMNFTEEREVEIYNTLPSVTLLGPTNWNATTNRSPEFSWSGFDAEGDSLIYEIVINEHKYSGPFVCSNDISENSISMESYVPVSDLGCLYDNGFYYNWSVRASDDGGSIWGDWSETWHFNVTASASIILVADDINFGSLSPGDVSDTSDNVPAGFVLENDGNVVVNVSLNSSAIWDNEPVDSDAYQFKVDNVTGEEGAFDWLMSIIDWFNMPITGEVVGLTELDYKDNKDSSEVDIKLTVPNGEAPGPKSSHIMFAPRLAE